jgi:hypothetical protein
MVRVTPTEFFSGELKRLKAHVDFLAVCFKVKIEGAVEVRPYVEVWSDGMQVDLGKYGATDGKESDEVTFSLRKLPTTDPDRVMYLAAVGGMISYSRRFEKPKPRLAARVSFGPVTLEQPIVLKPDLDSIIVWAMGGGDGLDLSKPEGVDKALKELPWAMILRLRVFKQE